MLDITVFGVPDLSEKTRVNSDGQIYLPLVNYVAVGGLDLQEAQAAIENAYSTGRFLTSPHVSVAVDEQAGGVVVMGEIAKPGIYTVTASKDTLFDVLTEAGGTTQTAGRVVTVTHRRDPDHPQTVVLSSDPQKLMASNMPLRAGDVVMVAKAGVFYVVGEVLQPSGFIMDNSAGCTALKALAMAHGPTRLAKLSDAKIVRQTPQGVKVIPVALNKVEQSKAPDVELLAGDILMVPLSKAKTTAYQAASMAQSVATFAAVSAF
jgi:polysaccharide export outer membrane protein